MTPPDNGDDWNKWGVHIRATLDRMEQWLRSIERRLWGVMITVIILLIGFVFSLLKGL